MSDNMIMEFLGADQVLPEQKELYITPLTFGGLEIFEKEFNCPISDIGEKISKKFKKNKDGEVQVDAAFIITMMYCLVKQYKPDVTKEELKKVLKLKYMSRYMEMIETAMDFGEMPGSDFQQEKEEVQMTLAGQESTMSSSKSTDGTLKQSESSQ